jgi:hypothetical protein
MRVRLVLIGIPLLLAGCDLSSLPHGNLGMPDMSGGPGFGNSDFNNKNYADPNPDSASGDAQRAAYQQHQQDQVNAAGMNSSPDLSHMSCSGGSTSSSGANAGTLSSSTSCHN